MQSILSGLLIGLIGVGILAGLILIVTGLKEPSMPKVKSRPILSRSDLACWRLLQQAASPLHVAPQVAMNALIEPVDGLDRSDARAIRSACARKAIDFVLFDDFGRVRLLVELGEPARRGNTDARCDSMAAHAGYRSVRIARPQQTELAVIRAIVAGALAAQPSAEPRGPQRGGAMLSTSAQLP